MNRLALLIALSITPALAQERNPAPSWGWTITEGPRVDRTQWNNWLRTQRPSSNIEDRRRIKKRD
jgi:hypothetical protein